MAVKTNYKDPSFTGSRQVRLMPTSTDNLYTWEDATNYTIQPETVPAIQLNEIGVAVNKIKWTQYTTLSDLDLTDADITSSGTLATICEAMSNYSIFRISTTDTVAWHKDLIGIYAGYGTLEITRIDINRVHLSFARSSNSAAEDLRYYCQYRPNPTSGYTNKISPWKRIATDADNYYNLAAGNYISTGADLNNLDYGVIGVYSGTVAQTLLNRPVDAGNYSATIVTESGNGSSNGEYKIQTYKQRNPISIWVRKQDASEWGTWIKIATSEDVEELKKSVSDGKKEVAAAITSMGVATSPDDSFALMAQKIRRISTGFDISATTAVAADVRSGKIFFNSNGARQTGTATVYESGQQDLYNRGSWSTVSGGGYTVTNEPSSYTIENMIDRIKFERRSSSSTSDLYALCRTNGIVNLTNYKRLIVRVKREEHSGTGGTASSATFWAGISSSLAITYPYDFEIYKTKSVANSWALDLEQEFELDISGITGNRYVYFGQNNSHNFATATTRIYLSTN